MPSQRLLHLRCLHRRRQGLPQLRKHRRHGHSQEGDCGLLGANVSRNNRGMGHCARRTIRMGILLREGAEPQCVLLRHSPVPLRPWAAVLRQGSHPDILELQLWSVRKGHWG
ncbi:hypothetical protein PHAVU_009G116550 [Phaseolus vulgaris]